jgi:hypothetical protein
LYVREGGGDRPPHFTQFRRRALKFTDADRERIEERVGPPTDVGLQWIRLACAECEKEKKEERERGELQTWTELDSIGGVVECLELDEARRFGRVPHPEVPFTPFSELPTTDYTDDMGGQDGWAVWVFNRRRGLLHDEDACRVMEPCLECEPPSMPTTHARCSATVTNRTNPNYGKQCSYAATVARPAGIYCWQHNPARDGRRAVL